MRNNVQLWGFPWLTLGGERIKLMRDDLQLAQYAHDKGYTVYSATVPQSGHKPYWVPADCLAFEKKRKRIWGLFLREFEGWVCADIASDGRYINHRRYTDLKEALDTEDY